MVKKPTVMMTEDPISFALHHRQHDEGTVPEGVNDENDLL